jgi:hypothetical protein
MFARVTTSIAPKDKLNETKKSNNDNAFLVAKKQKGYKGWLFLQNPETGEEMLINLWDTEENMKVPSFSPAGKLADALGVKFFGTKYYTVGIKD